MPCIFICRLKSDQEAAFLAAESPLFKELATRKSVQRGVPLAAEDRKSPVKNKTHLRVSYFFCYNIARIIPRRYVL